jgi:hypothetical protein
VFVCVCVSSYGAHYVPNLTHSNCCSIRRSVPGLQHSTGALGDACSRTQRGQFWKVVIREGNPGNPPAGYQELQDPQLLRVRSLLVMYLQRRLNDGGSLAEVVDLCGPHAASSPHDVPQWDSFGIDVDITGIVNSNTVVSVELKVPDLDEGHAVWCMSDTAYSITPSEENHLDAECQPSVQGSLRLEKGGGQTPAGEASASEHGLERAAKRKRLSGPSACGSGSSSFNKAKLQELELEAFEGFCLKFGMFRKTVSGDGNCMPSSVAQVTLWYDHIRGDKHGKLRRTHHEERSESIRKDSVDYCLEHSAEFQEFFVSDPTSKGDTGPQDGVRGKSALQWAVPMWKQGIYGDDLWLQCIARKLDKKIQVFSFDAATNAIRMKILFSRALSKEESARLQQTEDKPQASDFEDDSILRLALTQHQYQGSAHYDCIIAKKVCV